jgi:HEAT repeat protein
VTSYFNVMFGIGNRIELLVKLYLKKPLPPEKLALLIELVGAIPLRSLYEDITVFADHPDKEVRIRVARALGKLLIPDSVNILVALASDEAWEVKAQALTSLGKLGNRATLDILAKSLFSPYWYVRYNAGYGLANMGEEGINRLKDIAVQKQDRYASDMSHMVLGDLIYLEEAA